MNQAYKKISLLIKEADAILIGASNGLSIADGYHIFANNEWFRNNFADFIKKYSIQNILQGMFLRFSGPEEQWAFFARLAYRIHYTYKPSQMMLDLYELVKEKDYFVLTSNGEDHFTPTGFDSKKIFEIEGKLTEYRCANHCHEDIYNNEEAVREMAEVERDGLIPIDFLPKCPKCGGMMEPNLALTQSFFETKSWKEKAIAYQTFIENNQGKNILILELGVGYRNQMIKAPLMQLAAELDNCTYITFNKGELYIPKEIESKSIGIDADIADAICEIARLYKK